MRGPAKTSGLHAVQPSSPEHDSCREESGNLGKRPLFPEPHQ